MKFTRTSAEQYFYHPLSLSQIDELRLLQKKWIDQEKQLSLAFIFLAFIPLVAISLFADWISLTLAMVVEFLLYMWFKMQIPKILDKKYSFSVAIADHEFAQPFSDDLQFANNFRPTLFDDFPEFSKILNRQGRAPIKLEIQLVSELQKALH